MVNEAEADAFLSRMDLSEDAEFVEELQGIVEAVNHPSITLKALLWSELGYERGITAGCSSIIASQPNGTVIQGRNLDLGDARENLPFFYDFTFTRKGEPLFASTNWIGSVGVHT